MSNRNPALDTTLTHSRNNIFVAGVLLLLAAYIFLKRITLSGGALTAGDWLAMITAPQQNCSLKLSGAWTPPVQCLNTFLGDFVFLGGFFGVDAQQLLQHLNYGLDLKMTVLMIILL